MVAWHLWIACILREIQLWSLVECIYIGYIEAWYSQRLTNCMQECYYSQKITMRQINSPYKWWHGANVDSLHVERNGVMIFSGGAST